MHARANSILTCHALMATSSHQATFFVGATLNVRETLVKVMDAISIEAERIWTLFSVIFKKIPI